MVLLDLQIYLYNAVQTSASNVERTQSISNRLLGRLINRRLYQRRVPIQLRQDDETVSQPQFKFNLEEVVLEQLNQSHAVILFQTEIERNHSNATVLPVHFKQVWKELGLPSFCQEVVGGLKIHVLPNFKSMHNPIPISIPEGPKSEFITKEVQDLLVDESILKTRFLLQRVYSTKTWNESTSSSSRFKKVKYFHRKPIIQDGRYQEPTFNGKTRLLHQMELLVKLGFKLNFLLFCLFPSFDYVLTTDASESGAGATLKKGSRFKPTTQQLFRHQSPWWSNPGSISPLRTALEAVSQEESQLDWRAHSRIQCQSRPPQPSCRVESQVVEDDQELQLATQEGSIQSHPTSVRSNSDGSVCILSQPSNDKLLHNQNECTPTRLESIEAVSSVSTSNTFAFCAREDQLIEFHEGFYNTDISGVEVSNLVFDDSKSSSSSSTSSVSTGSGYIPRSINQRVNRINPYSDSTTMEVGDYSTFQSHVKSIINTQKPGTTELFMSSWQPSTLKVYRIPTTQGHRSFRFYK
ncbi:hypothetical protein ACTFIU_000050 [Dictyostelium citrinum]